MGKLGLLIATFFSHLFLMHFAKIYQNGYIALCGNMEMGSIACQVKSGFLDETHLDILKLGHSALTTTAVYLRMSRQKAKRDIEGEGVNMKLCVLTDWRYIFVHERSSSVILSYAESGTKKYYPIEYIE